MLKKSDDLYTSLLSYRVTPLSWCDLSPAELSMGRRLSPSERQDAHTTMGLSGNFQRDGQETESKTERELWFETSCKRSASYTWRYRGVDHHRQWAGVRKSDLSHAGRPSSYVVETPSGQIECNRSQLTVVPRENSETNYRSETETETPCRVMTRSRTGTAINPPDRL